MRNLTLKLHLLMTWFHFSDHSGGVRILEWEGLVFGAGGSGTSLSRLCSLQDLRDVCFPVSGPLCNCNSGIQDRPACEIANLGTGIGVSVGRCAGSFFWGDRILMNCSKRPKLPFRPKGLLEGDLHVFTCR